LHRGHANLLCIVPILTDEPKLEGGGKDPLIKTTTFHPWFETIHRYLLCCFAAEKTEESQNQKFVD
jgi:hypothetical protein